MISPNIRRIKEIRDEQGSTLVWARKRALLEAIDDALIRATTIEEMKEIIGTIAREVLK